MTADEKSVKTKFLSPASLLRDSLALARVVENSGFIPQAIVPVWRGGAPIAIVIHEYFSMRGINIPQIIVKASSYNDTERGATIRATIPEDEFSALGTSPRILLIDDIFDSGRTLKFLRGKLQKLLPQSDIRFATVYFHTPNESAPEYFLRRSRSWLVFPHERANLAKLLK